MSVTRKEAVKVWAERWRTLKVWPCSLADVTVDVRNRSGADSTGRAFYMERRIVISVSSDMADSLTTVLHEFAHAARPRRHDVEWTGHDDVWQSLFARAVREVTGIAVPETADNFRDLDRAATDAVRAWWKSSSNEFAFNLIAAKGKR